MTYKSDSNNIRVDFKMGKMKNLSKDVVYSPLPILIEFLDGKRLVVVASSSKDKSYQTKFKRMNFFICSSKSPLIQALANHQAGETVEYRVANVKQVVKIIKIFDS